MRIMQIRIFRNETGKNADTENQIRKSCEAVLRGCLSFSEIKEGAQNGETIKISPLRGGSKYGAKAE